MKVLKGLPLYSEEKEIPHAFCGSIPFRLAHTCHPDYAWVSVYIRMYTHLVGIYCTVSVCTSGMK